MPGSVASMMKRILQFQVVTEETSSGPKRTIFALDSDGALFSALLTRLEPGPPRWSVLEIEPLDD